MSLVVFIYGQEREKNLPLLIKKRFTASNNAHIFP